jgi:hypothetical protein
MRQRRAAKQPDMALIRRAFADNRLRTALGVVRKFPGESSHFEIDTENGRDVLIDVELQPNKERVLCRLGFGQDGVYRIPQVGREVAVIIPSDPSSLIADDLDNDPIIVAVLDTDVPAELDSDDIVVISAARVHVISDNTKIGPAAATAPALASESADLKARIAAWVPVPNDGGASLKTVFAAWPVPGATKVKVE